MLIAPRLPTSFRRRLPDCHCFAHDIRPGAAIPRIGPWKDFRNCGDRESLSEKENAPFGFALSAIL